jgi:imidazolonepropionase-like amidohydrolase
MMALTNAKLLTMDPSLRLSQGSVLIAGQLIQAVGENPDIPEGTQIIDCRGKWICPGFIDSHTHIGLEEEIYGEAGDDVNESSNPVTPELKAGDGINFMDLAFADALRGGVTRSPCMPGSANVIGGQAVFLRHLPEGGQGASAYREPWGLKAALGENPKRVYKDKSPKTRMASASLLRESLYVAARQLDKADLEAGEAYKKAALFKVLRREMPLLVHAHRADDIMTALRIQDEFAIDLIVQHGTEAHLIADELLKRDVAVFLGPLLVNRAKVEMKEVSFKNAARLHHLGIRFALITDHPVIPIEHLRVCAALTVREGLDEYTALQAMTITAAELLRAGDELGSITPGKQADLAVYSGHPLDFSSRVEQVMVDGQLIAVD